MKLLLTSSGINNASIHNAVVDLLGKPIAESNALIVPTGIYPFSVGAAMAYKAVCGRAPTPLCELGWKSLGLLELTALPSIDKTAWVPAIEETDALLVWGGDPLFLSYWMNQSGLPNLLSSLERPMVYVGVSAGSMVTAPIFGETYHKPYKGTGSPLTLEDMTFAGPAGEVTMNFITARGAGLTSFALIPHANHKDRPDASFANAERWAAKLPVPVYAIDDQTAIQVIDESIEVISEGEWKKVTR
ncbi:Type 1 glutamine amidotransferase-like domain-containing protein [Silvibacterium dinghuense]|uniref:Peptidase E n=1 Tax=Silvibacterium dinghuense TaxID=1560006 RepID=A0A4Q1SC86_9BACT|nr:Type 1 glutamine amidotransferase-like domain-containing protein [Silvibacterium dinghuense]RXS94583.1 peptidase E [Silvibacterium dinghuense]GGH15208.1 peptidase E [Silvibacterium dinghuense]